jgi:2-aminoadipate transaminase
VEAVSFARGVPAPECIPVEELADCAETVLRRDGRTLLSYGDAAGYIPLRSLVARWFEVHPYRVVLTNGALSGLGLLAQRFGRNQNVFVEYPTYDRANNLFLAAGGALTAIVVDEHGMDPEDMALHLQTTMRPALTYVIPTFQNPTGHTMSLERRRRVVEMVDMYDLLVVEDDPYGLVRYEGEPVPALFDLSGGRCIYMSSFSKTISPGLRVGFMILPSDELAAAVVEEASSAYITPVLTGQAIVHEFISRGAFEPNLERVKGLLRVRRDAMLAALEKHFSGAKWSRPNGGYFVWLELPLGTVAQTVIDRAEGVTAVAGQAFGGMPNTVRLAFSFAAPDEIEAGIERLAAAV